MSSQGLIGFRYQEQDKLAYNRSESRPDMLGLKILSELHSVDDWDAVKKRTEAITPVAETHRLDYFDGYPIAEIRRHLPLLKSLLFGTTKSTFGGCLRSQTSHTRARRRIITISTNLCRALYSRTLTGGFHSYRMRRTSFETASIATGPTS